MSKLELRDLSVTFASAAGSVYALRSIDISVTSSEFITVIGSNGAGKSTLLRALSGAQKPTHGSIILGGTDIGRVAEHRRARWVAHVSQNPADSVSGELTVFDNLALALSRGRRRSIVRGARARHRTTAPAVLAGCAEGLQDRLHDPAGLLSGGQRQLVALSMAVASTPDLLLLDEHTAALDPHMAETVMRTTDRVVRDKGLTTVMITHNMDHAAAYGDRLLIMDGGRIVDELDRETRRAMGPEGLIARFRAVAKGQLSDRSLG